MKVEVNGKDYDIRITSSPLTILREAMWDIFNTTFRPGGGANKDFSTATEFNEILDHPEVLVIYSMEEEEIAVFAIFSRSEDVILQYAKRDYVSLSLQAPGKSIFWVFLFCPNGLRRYPSPHTKALFTAIARYAHKRRGVVVFDEDPAKHLSRRIVEYLAETANIIATPQVVQVLHTTMLSFVFPPAPKMLVREEEEKAP